jgi:hypothetical protein
LQESAPALVFSGIQEVVRKSILTFSILWAVGLPAAAQGWSYNPYTGGSTWLGLSRLFSSPLNAYSTPSTPLYLLDPAVRYGTYYAGQSLTNGNRSFNYGGYADQEPFADPRQRTRPVVTDGNGVRDQVVHAKPFHQDFSGQSKGLGSNGSPYSPNNAATGGPSNVAAGGSPLAAGFIDVVNTKFQGDISKALFDPDTRAYARSVGLIDSNEIFDADLNPQKLQTIRGILNDSSEDATVRINAVRMLLKH